MKINKIKINFLTSYMKTPNYIKILFSTFQICLYVIKRQVKSVFIVSYKSPSLVASIYNNTKYYLCSYRSFTFVSQFIKGLISISFFLYCCMYNSCIFLVFHFYFYVLYSNITYNNKL